jgi:Domain of unknown function (DUF4351)
MSQFPHDQFAKNLFELLLKPFGTVQIQRAIRSEAKFVDIYFEPDPSAIAASELGLLARCVDRHPAMFEPSRNPVAIEEIQSAISEVADLPPAHPYRGNALDLFLSLKLELEAKQNTEPEELELIMQLSPLFLEKIDAAKQEGRQEGRLELILQLANRRFGGLSIELQERVEALSDSQLTELGEALFDFTSLVNLEDWLKAIATDSSK